MAALDETAGGGCVVLFPGALGDFLCFLPTAEALRRESRDAVTLVARSDHAKLVDPRHFAFVGIERREIAGLFAPRCGEATRQLLGGFDRALSWTGHREPRFRANLAAAVGGTTATFAFDDFRPGEHAVDRFARCAGVRPRPVRVPIAPQAVPWADQILGPNTVVRDTLVLHPGSGSARKNWSGMEDLAAEWRRAGGRIVALQGPAEADFSNCDRAVRNASIGHVAALLSRAAFYIGNDSGISHLAGIVGCPGVALFACTDPTIWRPHGKSVIVMQAERACDRCGADVFCTHRLGVDAVLDQVDHHRSESYRRRS